MDSNNCFVKKITYMKEWTAQANPPKEANTVKKMNDQLLLLSSNKATYCIKEWTTAGSIFKKKIVFKAISTPKKQLFVEINCSKCHPCKCKCLQFLF